jgi:hypothetical protein
MMKMVFSIGLIMQIIGAFLIFFSNGEKGIFLGLLGSFIATLSL